MANASNTGTGSKDGAKGAGAAPAAQAADTTPAEVGKTPAVAGFKMPEGTIQVQSAHRYYWFPYLRADGSAQAITLQDIEKGRPNPCHCVVLMRQERHDSTPEKPGFFYLVMLRQPCLVVDRDKVVSQRPVGDVIVVDERVQLRGLEGFTKGPNTVECVIEPQGKIKGGQDTVALFNLHAIPTQKPRPQLPASVAKALPGPEDGPSPAAEIPFS
jgi:hypothetical protein